MAVLAALASGIGVLGADLAGAGGVPVWVVMAGAILGSTTLTALVNYWVNRRSTAATAGKTETENVEIEDRIRRALIEETEQRFTGLRDELATSRERIATLETLLEERQRQYRRAVKERDDILQEFRLKVLAQDKHIQALQARVLGDRDPTRHDDVDLPVDDDDRTV